MSSKTYFDRIAGQWDTMRSEFFPDAVREKAIARAMVVPGSLAADLGAGSGFITEELLKYGVRVIAVDQSEKMLQLMREKFGAVAPLDCRSGQAEQLPIATASVDYAFANMYLHHVEHPAIAIKEMARIVKPGGRVVITDLDEHTFEFLVAEQHDRWMGFKREEVKRWFEEAGLQSVAVESVNASCCADSACKTERAEVSIFLAMGVKR